MRRTRGTATHEGSQKTQIPAVQREIRVGKASVIVFMQVRTSRRRQDVVKEWLVHEAVLEDYSMSLQIRFIYSVQVRSLTKPDPYLNTLVDFLKSILKSMNLGYE